MITYTKYKNSNIEWLGNIPEHWKVDRLKWSVKKCINGIWGSEPVGENDTVCIRVADFNRTKLKINPNNFTYRFIEKKEIEERIIKKGDILIEKSGGGEKQLVGAVMQFDLGIEAVTSNFIAKMSIQDNLNSRFLTYLHYHLYSSKVNYRSIKQTTGIQNLDTTLYFSEFVAIPLLDEQKAIADFLDYKTEQIDELIEQKEKLLELLEEKRVALITRAVTKGLNPDVKMKPSGIGWLGDVPEHFTISKINFEFNIKLGKMLQPEPKNEYDILKEYLKAGNIFWDKIDIGDKNEMYFSQKELADLKLEKGDLLISEGGDVGRSCIWTEDYEMYYQNALIRARNLMNQKATTKYLYYWLYFLKTSGNLNIICNTATISHYTAEKVKATPFIFPDINEQEKTLKYIENSLAPLKELKLNINNAIEKLKEYRSALITAAVTGKIDVRNFNSENINETERI